MKFVERREGWPISWNISNDYDRIEMLGTVDPSRLGYFYSYQSRKVKTLELVRRFAPPRGSVLDVAGAQGNFTLPLAELGYEVTWNDIREELAAYVQLKHERGVVKYAPGDITQLEFKSRFDVILASEIIEHVAHPDVFLKRLSGFLKPGGHLILTTPNGKYVRNALPRFTKTANPSLYEKDQFLPNASGHIFLIEPKEWEALRKVAGLSIVHFELLSSFLTAGWLGTSFLLPAIRPKLLWDIEKWSRNSPKWIRERFMTHTAVVLQSSS